MSFDVVVAADAADGTQILNTAVLSSRDVDGTPFTAIASVPAAVTVHSVPDVVIDKSHTGAFVRGQQGTFTLIVSNIGGRPTTDPVAIDDTLPAGLGIVSASGTGWACTTAANSLHCDRGDSLASGAAFPAVSVLVNVLESAPGTVVNTGVTSGGGETNTGNNTDTDTVPIGSVADVAIVKSVDPDDHGARNERDVLAGRDEQRAVDGPERDRLRSSAGGHDVRLGRPVRVRAREHDGQLLAGRSRQGPERHDHARLGRAAGARPEDAHEHGDRDLDDARLRPEQQQGQRDRHGDRPAALEAPRAQDGRPDVGLAGRHRDVHDRAQGAVQDRRQGRRRLRHAPGQARVRLRAGRDVQQGTRLLAPRPRQGGLDDELQDHGQGGRQRHPGRRQERRRRRRPTTPAGSRRAPRSRSSRATAWPAGVSAVTG